jgi:hypothetical protein
MLLRIDIIEPQTNRSKTYNLSKPRIYESIAYNPPASLNINYLKSLSYKKFKFYFDEQNKI